MAEGRSLVISSTIEPQRRRAEGKTDREIRRCIKRYLARHLYRALNKQLNQAPQTT
jgi:hypothetical protein